MVEYILYGEENNETIYGEEWKHTITCGDKNDLLIGDTIASPPV